MQEINLTKLTHQAVADIIALPLTSGRYGGAVLGRLRRSVYAIGRKFRAKLLKAGFCDADAYHAWKNMMDIAQLEINAE